MSLACNTEEFRLSSTAEEVYFGKAKDVVGDLRSRRSSRSYRAYINPKSGIAPLSETNRDRAAHREMISGISGK